MHPPFRWRPGLSPVPSRIAALLTRLVGAPPNPCPGMPPIRGPALRPLGRIVGRILLAGIPVNFAWEMLQGPLFTGMPASFWGATLLCAQASVGDGFLLLALYGLGLLATRRVDWGREPGWRGVALALLGGAALAIGIEWMALWAGRWGYGPAMPLVPRVGVALLPLLQMLLIPLPVFRWAAALRSRSG